MPTIRTRFAPSPTGYLHIGGARTALFSWLFSRHHGGEFVLRIEDTDQERSTVESVNAILEGMTWLGLDYDEGPFYQTQHMARYKEVIQQLLDAGQAYRCYMTKEELEQLREEQMARKEKPRYDGRYRDYDGPPREGVDPVIRFRNPMDGHVGWNDLVRGPVSIANTELDDLVIARADGTPTYNFTVVVDDMDMDITHVIRGDDHVNNTPRQINIYRGLGVEPPRFGHVPMILGDDGKRLSKRHGAMSVMEYREQGYLPEAVLNYLVRLGWSHGDQEVFTLDELIQKFDIDEVNKAPSTFNTEKLRWLNQQYLMHTDPSHIARHLGHHLGEAGIDPSEGPELVKVVEALRERAHTLDEMAELSGFIYREFDDYEEKAAKKHLRPVARIPLEKVRDALAGLTVWTPEAIHDAVEQVSAALEVNMGKVAQPLRVATVGRAASPGIEITLDLVGRHKTLARIDRALAYIEARENANG